ncbi:hypothetical protein M1145_01250 [Patescibacteria group bacterium]|nr:hypothetical protein [Patescibacteria group bacterium]
MNIYIKSSILLLVFSVISLLFIFSFKMNVYANTCSVLGGSGGSGSVCNFSPPVATTNCNLGSIPTIIVDVLFTIAGLLFFVMIVISGIKMITAGDDKEKYSAAKTTLTHAVIGIAIVAGSYLVLEIILSILGINIGIFNVSGYSIGACSI